jgi:hypothetical protein
MILMLALVASFLGLAWLALAMDAHWRQVRPSNVRSPGATVALRVLGTAALVLSLVLCLVADHASMAVLVWVMALAGAALLVAFTLSWKPRMLAPLVMWVRATAEAARGR